MTLTRFCLGFAGFLLLALPAGAQELEVVLSTEFDAETISQGAALTSSDGLMQFTIPSGTVTSATRVDVKTLDPVIMEGSYASFSDLVSVPSVQRRLVGNVYLFDVLDKSTYTSSPLSLEIGYASASHGIRRMYFWNGVTQMWHPLPSQDNAAHQSVRAIIQLPYARIAVFEDPLMEVGKASWYDYKDCDCAASPDYPKGTYLVVSRADDPERWVTVVVNDWGPDRAVHPDRVIDLDRVAFEKIGNPRGGIVDVVVKLLQ